MAERIGGRHVVDVTDEADVFTQIITINHGLEFGAVIAAALVIAGHEDLEVGRAPVLQQLARLDDEGLALPARQPAGEKKPQGMFARAPGLLELHDLADLEGLRIEALQVDTARYGDDALGQDIAIGGEDVGARKIGIGDGHVGARHLAVVPALEA